jgi:hypothetical protein
VDQSWNIYRAPLAPQNQYFSHFRVAYSSSYQRLLAIDTAKKSILALSLFSHKNKCRYTPGQRSRLGISFLNPCSSPISHRQNSPQKGQSLIAAWGRVLVEPTPEITICRSDPNWTSGGSKPDPDAMAPKPDRGVRMGATHHPRGVGGAGYLRSPHPRRSQTPDLQ